jgi:hypothetical protein
MMINKETERNIYTIYPLHQEKFFSEDEALELVNIFLAITSKAKNQINSLNSQLELHKMSPSQTDAIQFRLNESIQKWSEKVRRLGGIPLALYKVKIPAQEDAYYTWEFPNASLEFHIHQ